MTKPHKLGHLISALCLSMGLATTALAADPLAGSQWVTYENGQPKAVINITQTNQQLSGTIVKLLDPRAKGKAVCSSCKGKYHNKSLIGATVFTGLKPIGQGHYEGGSVIEPESGKTYAMSAALAGNSLNVRGYLGIKALGRNQTWKKAN